LTSPVFSKGPGGTGAALSFSARDSGTTHLGGSRGGGSSHACRERRLPGGAACVTLCEWNWTTRDLERAIPARRVMCFYLVRGLVWCWTCVLSSSSPAGGCLSCCAPGVGT
jgi:hypothetical protein